MRPEEQHGLVRRVVTGLTSTGLSTIVADAKVDEWITRPSGSVVMNLWSVASVPVAIDAGPAPVDHRISPPTEGGSAVRVAVFPAGYNGGARPTEEQGSNGDDTSGMHRTRTVDVVTVLEGEIWLVLEEQETLLRTGDCVVQRGTRHAWHNRSDRPCTLVATMFAAT